MERAPTSQAINERDYYMDYYKQKLDEREELAELNFWFVVIGLPVCLIVLS